MADEPGANANAEQPLDNPSAASAPSSKGITKDADDSAFPFSVTVSEVYDGPLDLLLDLIRNQDIDIYDIPMARITAQFLSYVEHLKQSDVDSAGEFIYMASLLIHIKSRMLLPREPREVTGDAEGEDPRRELVERLLEHERFKAAAQMLMQKQQLEEASWSNPATRQEFSDAQGSDREVAADTVDLVRVFRELLDRARQRPVLDVDEESVTVAQMIDYLRRRLMMEDRPVLLRKLLAGSHSERALISMFLAMLELVRLQAILLRQEGTFGEILVKKTDGFEGVATETRDDWR